MILRLSVVLLAGAALFLPIPSSVIERYYSTGLFPPLQRAITSLSNSVGFALFDLVVVCGVLALLAAIGFDLRARGSWARRLFRVTARLVLVGAVVYLAFLAAWGLNYRREPLREKLAFAPERVSAQAVEALAREAAAALNALHAPAHAAGWVAPSAVDATLAAAFHDASGVVGGSRQTVPGRPKRTLMDLYFRRAGVAGMTDPFFLETLVTSTLLPFERPAVVAHEWAHLAGFSDEGEANFVAWLACLRGAAPHQYSGWLFLYTEVAAALPRDLVRDIGGTLDAGPREDLQAIRTRLLGDISPQVSAAGWQVYDQYLKANSIDAGAASYGEVVQLVLGTDLR